jgi:phytoene desaturase
VTEVRAAVIGSGFGGLAAAARLQALGGRVTLFEARDQPGGRAYVYRDQGFTFDAGPTVITAPECLEEVFAASGRRMADYVQLLPVTPFYRLVWADGTRFDYVGEQTALEDQIRRISPTDLDGYRRFHAYTKKVFAKGYTELGATPFLRFWDMVKVAPHLAALRADRSVYATVSRFIRSEHLRQAFSFHPLLVGGNPYSTSSIYTLIHHLEREWGVWFPKGGTGALVRGLVDLITDTGGEVRVNSPVRKVRVEGGKHHVTTDAGTEAFDVVVSNADLHHTYATLYADEPRAAPTARRLERMTWSMSLVVIYFGTKVRYPELAHHTILFGPRYKGLLDDIFGGSKVADDFSLYLHAPTVTDPGMAPPGGEAFYVLSPVPHLGHADVDWDAFGPVYADRILEALEGHLPGLRANIVTKRVFTPADFRDTLNGHHGSAFSVAPLLTQSAYFRPHNRDARIPGLYVVGAGTHPGAGVPGVVNSAKATVGLIQQDFQLRPTPAPSGVA